MAKFNKDVKELVSRAEQAGWRKDQRPGKHIMLYPTNKDCAPVSVPISLSDWRGYQNLRSKLRQSGLDC